MSTSWERTCRADILKACLASISGKAFRLGTEEGKQLSFEAGVLATRMLEPEYDSDEALDRADAELEQYRAEYEKLRQKQPANKKSIGK